MFKRVIATMRSAHHGGLLLILPQEFAAGVASNDFLRAQYAFEEDELDEAVFELSHLIAGLADVDGAVVMTKRFELLGFGAEIRGSELSDVLTVQRALDLEGETCVTEPTDSLGTRHRSAYRLCQQVHDALAVGSPRKTGAFVSSPGGTARLLAGTTSRADSVAVLCGRSVLPQG